MTTINIPILEPTYNVHCRPMRFRLSRQDTSYRFSSFLFITLTTIMALPVFHHLPFNLWVIVGISNAFTIIYIEMFWVSTSIKVFVCLLPVNIDVAPITPFIGRGFILLHLYYFGLPTGITLYMMFHRVFLNLL